jgi:hypothetical protein
VIIVHLSGARLEEKKITGGLSAVALYDRRSPARQRPSWRPGQFPGGRDALGSLPLVANGITSFGELTEVIPVGEVPGTPA